MINALWVFEVAAHKWSTQTVQYGGNTYTAKVIPDTFSGVAMRYDPSGALIAPNDLDFEIVNDSGLLPGDLEGEYCTIRLVLNDIAVKAWIFKINRAVEYYGKIKCYCVDFLHDYLTGDYPNTPSPHEIWSSDDEAEDDYCIPVVLDSAYIPVRSVNTGAERFYVLGVQGPTYTVHEVRSPHSWPSVSTWAAATYSMNGFVNSGWQLLQPIIADSTGDGNADAPGLWRSGDRFYDMLCYYERSDTASITSPIAWIEYVLKDFGIPAAYIGDTFTALEAAIDQTLYFTGGFFRKQNREKLLVSMLSQIDCYIACDEKVEIYQFAKASKATFDNVIQQTFRPQRVTKHANNAGRVHWPEAYDKPMDVLNGKGIVPIAAGGATDAPSSEILKCWYMAGQSINAQKAGILHFQKKYGQKNRMSFSVDLTSFEDMTIHPGQVITISNPLYGGTHTLILTDLMINRDLRAEITGVELYALEEWADLTTTLKDVTTDTSDGFSIADTDYSGQLDLDADWNALLNIPDRFKETASLGVNVTDSYLGYYDGAVFQSYISSNGHFQFRGDANNYINWNGTALNVVGLINAWNKSGDLTKIDGGEISTNTITATQIAASTITATQIATNTITANRMNVTTLSSIAANIGTVTAGIIRDINHNLTIDLNNSTIKVSHDNGLTLDGLAIKLEYGGSHVGYMGTNNVGVTLTSPYWATINGDTRVNLWSAGDIEIRAGATGYINLNAGPYVRPKTDNSMDFGYLGRAWRKVVSHSFIEASHVPKIDDNRALDQLKNIKEWEKDGKVNHQAHYAHVRDTHKDEKGVERESFGISLGKRCAEMEKMIWELNQEIEALKNESREPSKDSEGV